MGTLSNLTVCIGCVPSPLNPLIRCGFGCAQTMVKWIWCVKVIGFNRSGKHRLTVLKGGKLVFPPLPYLYRGGGVSNHALAIYPVIRLNPVGGTLTPAGNGPMVSKKPIEILIPR